MKSSQIPIPSSSSSRPRSPKSPDYLFPPGTGALQAAFNAHSLARIFEPAKRVLPRIPDIALDVETASAKYYRTTRRAWYGSPLAEWSPVGTALRAQNLKAVHDGWTTVAEIYGKRESAGPWMRGAQPIYADFVVLAMLIFTYKIVPSDEWETMLTWHDGLWARPGRRGRSVHAAH